MQLSQFPRRTALILRLREALRTCEVNRKDIKTCQGVGVHFACGGRRGEATDTKKQHLL